MFIGLLACFLSKDSSSQQTTLVRSGQLDTTVRTDTFKRIRPVNDPRKAFRDLFITGNNPVEDYSVQLNPRAISFVQDYMLSHSRQLEQMKGWGKPYFDMMEKILNTEGVPGEMKYLAVIESDLRSNALSWAGAVGPWQFMPGTARRMGLKVGPYLDERTDYYKSTHAAAKYLKELFATYGDWLLVIAAYNGGVGSVDHAIRRSGSHNFWCLRKVVITLRNLLPHITSWKAMVE